MHFLGVTDIGKAAGSLSWTCMTLRGFFSGHQPIVANKPIFPLCLVIFFLFSTFTYLSFYMLNCFFAASRGTPGTPSQPVPLRHGRFRRHKIVCFLVLTPRCTTLFEAQSQNLGIWQISVRQSFLTATLFSYFKQYIQDPLASVSAELRAVCLSPSCIYLSIGEAVATQTVGYAPQHWGATCTLKNPVLDLL